MGASGSSRLGSEVAAPPAAPMASRWRLLVAPFAYFFHSRVPHGRQKIGWVLGYVLPVLGLAATAHGGLGGLLPAALMVAAVYTAYEFGYLVNDTLSIEREAQPTLRLPKATRDALRTHLALALVARLGIAGVLLALLLWIQGPAMAAAVLGWALLWPLFALYNRWRGRITIALHFMLVGLRCTLPIIAAAPALEPGLTVPLLLLYALPNTLEAAWKPRYGLKAWRDFAGGAHRFRVVWSAAMAAAGLALVWARPSEAAWLFLGVSLYYLLFRSGAGLLRSQQPLPAASAAQAVPPDGPAPAGRSGGGEAVDP